MRKKNRKIRITLDLTPQAYDRLERLERNLDVDSKADVLRQALQLLEFFADHTRNGATFTVKSRNSEPQTIVLLASRAMASD